MTEAEMKEERRGTRGSPKLFVYARTTRRPFRLAVWDPYVALFLCNQPACKDYQREVQLAANSVSQVSRNVKSFTT